MIRKVNIDELIDLLMKYRKDTEYVDIRLEEKTNTLTLGPHKAPQPKENKDEDDDIINLNQLVV